MWEGIRFEILPVQTRGVFLYEASQFPVQTAAFAFHIRASPGKNARPWHRHHRLIEESRATALLFPENTVQDERKQETPV
jgi:hypothetical protein